MTTRMIRFIAVFCAGLLAFAGCVSPTQPVMAPESPAAAPAVAAEQQPVTVTLPAGPTVVTLASPSPLLEIRVMVKVGSTADPVGKEGLAALVARALVQGGFGDPADPTTKEDLAEIVQPWGDGALPSVLVSSRTTTFGFTVPREVLETYINRVMRPMFASPLFQQAEVERIGNEALSRISSARFEDLESLGLAAIDEYVLAGTRYEHQPFGAEESLKNITRDDVVAFFRDYYRPGNIIVGVSTADADVVKSVADVARGVNPDVTTPVPALTIGTVAPISGREAVVIEEPNAPATSVHLGFPLPINRTDADFWPLYVANVWLGTHRDSFGRLYQAIREERGYNYGDYSYIEFVTSRPRALFPPFNTPRTTQYFSIWIRPIAADYAVHLMKAATYELDRLIRGGLTDDEVAAAKIKAKVLYINLGDSVERLLAAKMDDAFYGMSPGYLEGYLARIDAVTPAELNRVVRKYLQTDNVKYLVITDSKHADQIVNQLRKDGPVYGKTLKDYQLTQVKLEGGQMAWQIPEDKLEMLRLDALWANYPLGIRSVSKVPVDSVFKTGAFVAGVD